MTQILTAFVSFVEMLRALAHHVPGLRALAEQPFLFRPLLLLIVLGLVSGAVGTLVNLRKLEFNAEAMVHSVFPGIVAGFVIGGSDMILPGAAVVAVFVVIALTIVSRTPSNHEGGTAVVLTGFFALGITLSLRKGDMSGQLEALMFGRLLEVTDSKLLQSLVVCVLALVLLALTWKENVLVAHDREGAAAMGINVALVDVIINVAIAAVVVSASSAIGVLLVIAYLVVPGAAGRLVAPTANRMALVASLLAIVAGWGGLHIALAPWPHPVSPQASVVLTLIALFGACIPVSLMKRGR